VLFRSKFDKYFSVEERNQIAERFKLRFQSIAVNVVIVECRDQKDNMFLELAVASDSVCIISGDDDLLVLNPFRNTQILNAAEFLKTF
jgi:putative PIN family toxin of toxin-antitoxin system